MANKLSLLCVSGTREKIQMAAMLAATAAATGEVVTVFLSMNALGYFIRDDARTPPAEGDIGRLMAQKNVPPFRHLFEQAKELGGARLYACSMALDVLGVEPDRLEAYIDGPMGLTAFLTDASGGQLVTF
jgi:peroxiredoxin family protein